MTIVSVTSMLVWADLGLGSGLMTRLTGHIARNDSVQARKDISSTYMIVASVGTLVGAFAILSPFVLSWGDILNISPEALSDATTIAVVCLVCFAINMPLALIQRVQYAAQQVSISNAFTATGPLLSLGLVLVTTLIEQSAGIVVLSATVGPLIANILATVWFYRRNRDLAPKLRHKPGPEVRFLVKLGGLFVLISLASSLANNSDNLVIAHTLGADFVADFSVTARLMGAMGLVINLVNLPLWPATADALAKNDGQWVRQSVRRIALISVLFVSVGTLVLILLSDWLVSLLSGDIFEADVTLFLCLGAWWLVVASTSPIMMVQNAAGVLRPQLLGWTLFLFTAIPLKLLLVPQFGISVAPLVGTVSYLLCVVPLAIYGLRRSLEEPDSQRNLLVDDQDLAG